VPWAISPIEWGWGAGFAICFPGMNAGARETAKGRERPCGLLIDHRDDEPVRDAASVHGWSGLSGARVHANQEAHHRGQTYKEELLVLFCKHNIEYDERYLWD
jgi:hypothetical protein